MMKRRIGPVLLIVSLLLTACGSDSPAAPTNTPAPPPPTPTFTPDQLIGKPIKGSGPEVYRLMENGEIRHLVDWATFIAWGYAPGDMIQLDDQDLAAYPLGAPLTRWVTGETDDTLYFLRRSQRYPIDAETLVITGGSDLDVITLPDDLLHQFVLAEEPLAIPDSYFHPADPPGWIFLDFPDPRTDYTVWLRTWPRPAHDNGRCLHAVQYPAGDTYEVLEQIARLEQINARWALVNYTNRDQFRLMAPLFAQAGITVIWRPFVRPYETYDDWAEDVRFLKLLRLPPYIQVYNEPSLEAEWDGHPMDQTVFLDNLIPAVSAVYEAGGYVGIQSIDPDWTRAILQRLKSEKVDAWDRLFFVPHMYGGNHPPEYDADIYSVIGGFQEQARVFQEEIGFVPPMIAGEGGWRPGEASDTRYPAISEEMHRDYHVAVFEWFRTGQMPNGDALPDYLFAWCPWLLSDPTDPAAWWDSASGDRTLTIEAVEALPDFERRFSWDEQ